MRTINIGVLKCINIKALKHHLTSKMMLGLFVANFTFLSTYF